MANQLYPKAKEDFLAGNLNLSSNTITIALIDTDVYTFDSAHEDRADVPNTAVISTANLASKTITGGVFDADDATFETVSGANCEALILFHDDIQGGQPTSRLIAYIFLF
jgi:heme A synthase